MPARSFASRCTSWGLISLVTIILSGVSLMTVPPTPTRANDTTFLYVNTGSRIERYTTDGVFLNTIVPPLPSSSWPADIAFGPDGNLYVIDGVNIVRYDGSTGASLGTFLTLSSYGFLVAYNMTFDPDGNLYVGGQFATEGSTWSKVERFDGRTGAHIDTFIPAITSGNRPQLSVLQMIFGPDGNLYISTSLIGILPTVVRYDGHTGALLGTIITTASSAAMTFGPDGDLYMGYAGVLKQYDPVTGAERAAWPTFTSSDIAFGPDGNLYGIRQNDDVVLRYHLSTGAAPDTIIASTNDAMVGANKILFYQRPPSCSTLTSTPNVTTGTSTVTLTSTPNVTTGTPSSSPTAIVSNSPTGTPSTTGASSSTPTAIPTGVLSSTPMGTPTGTPNSATVIASSSPTSTLMNTPTGTLVATASSPPTATLTGTTGTTGTPTVVSTATPSNSPIPPCIPMDSTPSTDPASTIRPVSSKSNNTQIYLPMIQQSAGSTNESH